MTTNSILSRWVKKSFIKSIPLQASFELTHSCNQSCSHCYLEKCQTLKPLLLTDVKHILKQLRSAGTLYLTLMGGEAMLHPDFFEIAKHAKTLGFHLSMITNGQLINNCTAAKSLKKYFSNITFSLYSLNPDIHDMMTGIKNSHQKTTAAIKHCQKESINIGINCLLTKSNIDSFFDLLSWCTENNFHLKYDPMVTCKVSKNISNITARPSKKQIDNFYKTIKLNWPNKLQHPVQTKPNFPCCNIARMKCAIDPAGNLLGCLEIRKILGNLLTDSFKTIWNNSTTQKIKNITLSDLELNNSNLSCYYEHCPGMSLNEFDNPLLIHPYLHMIAEIKEKYFLKPAIKEIQ